MRTTKAAAALTVIPLAVAGLTACGGSSSSSDKVASNCKAAHTFSTVTKGQLTVAGFDLPPYGQLKGSTASGVDMDILRAIAKKECLTVTPKWMSAASVIPTVQSNRADVGVADWYRTEARQKVVNLTNPLYVDQMGITSKAGISDIAQLKGKNVGTVDGYLWVADMKKYLGSSLKIYPSAVNLNQDLKAGRIDIAVDSYGSQKVTNPSYKVEIAKSNPAIAASQEPAQAAFPLPKSNAALLSAFNEDIADLVKDGSIKKILKDNKLDESLANTGAPRLIK